MTRGVRLLARGETIVTDRLHGVLIGLQMGRRVVAIDDAHSKIRHYAETWLSDGPADLCFARDLRDASRMTASAEPDQE
jgi:pyruvyl transferase EpsO